MTSDETSANPGMIGVNLEGMSNSIGMLSENTDTLRVVMNSDTSTDQQSNDAKSNIDATKLQPHLDNRRNGYRRQHHSRLLYQHQVDLQQQNVAVSTSHTRIPTRRHKGRNDIPGSHTDVPMRCNGMLLPVHHLLSQNNARQRKRRRQSFEKKKGC